MPLEQLANIAEVIGVVVVVVTMIFLTLQMRQNTKTLRSAAAQNAHEMAESMYSPVIADADLADLILRGLRDPATLSEVETARFTAFWQNAFFTFQNWFYQRQVGVLDEGIWWGWSKVLTDIYQTPGIRNFWKLRRHYFSNDFRAYLETDLFVREPSPEYRPLGTSPISSTSNSEA